MIALFLPRGFEPGGIPVAYGCQLESKGRGDLFAVMISHAEQRSVSHQPDSDRRSVGHPANVTKSLDQLVLEVGMHEGSVVVAQRRIE